jgi:hypothetical protein
MTDESIILFDIPIRLLEQPRMNFSTGLSSLNAGKRSFRLAVSRHKRPCILLKMLISIPPDPTRADLNCSYGLITDSLYPYRASREYVYALLSYSIPAFVYSQPTEAFPFASYIISHDPKNLYFTHRGHQVAFAMSVALISPFGCPLVKWEAWFSSKGLVTQKVSMPPS